MLCTIKFLLINTSFKKFHHFQCLLHCVVIMCLETIRQTKILLWGSIGTMCSFDEVASDVATPKMVNLHDQNWYLSVPKMHMFHMTWLCNNHIPTFINSFVSNWWFKFNCMVVQNVKLVKFIFKHIRMHWFQMWFWLWKHVFNKIIIFMLFKAWMHNINYINQNVILKIIISSM